MGVEQVNSAEGQPRKQPGAAYHQDRWSHISFEHVLYCGNLRGKKSYSLRISLKNTKLILIFLAVAMVLSNPSLKLWHSNDVLK